MLVSPLQLLNAQVPVRARAPSGVFATDRTISYNLRLAEGAPDTYILDRGFPSFGESEMVGLKLALLRMRYCLLESPELQVSSSVYEKYLQPVVDLVNRFFFPPDNAHGPLQARSTEGSENIRHLAHIGFRVDDSDSPGRVWKGPRTEVKTWKASKRCICVVLFVDVSTIQVESLPCVLYAGSPMASLVAEAMVQCQETEATYAIITDEVRSLVLRSNVDLETDIDAEIFVAEKVSIRQIITHFVYRETREKGLCVLDYVSSDPVWSGVTASRNPRPLPRLLLRRSFEDFDVYTMQRDKLAWDDFMIWWKIYDEEAGISGMAPWNLQPGTRLPASQLRIFGEGGHQVWIPQGRPFIPIPFETKALVVRRYRPREDHLHHLYAGRVHDPNSQGHSFEISSAISAGRAQYSQTFLGRFDGEGPLMCLKLFDERFFPLPERAWGHQYRHSRERLTDFNLALDMIRREEAVYKRLEYLQGYLIPHCYGFHKFLLPGGWHVYGLLMEAIDGPTLEMLDIKDRPQEQQIDFITRLRHGLRAIRFAGIEQTDWHLNQILCPPDPRDPSLAPDIVFIDFAFALQNLGEEEGCPLHLDPRNLENALYDWGIDEDIMKSCWFEATEEEY